MRLETLDLKKNNIIKFSTSSLTILAIKVFLLWVFENYLSSELSYALSHILIFFISFFIHCKFTFGQKYSSKKLIKYFRAVILVKLIDYFLFFFIVKKYEINSLMIAVFITFLIFLVRYFLMKLVFIPNKKKSKQEFFN